ncbi:hypothetical protein [Methylorubrum populi]|uniref:Uncharacterized protein n=1 Tax=Methylorubrum populi TaxID=223967 RepID=A0A833J7W0_9HYPH|nr:hypothetical protein [Methylorubrum populi]KAB7786363.1 hypothetical protein F8B43_1764 [Methylorubrum populi]
MARRVSRKLELFSVHAHNNNEEIDYKKIVSTFKALPRSLRITKIGNMVFGFPVVTEMEGIYFMQVLEGDPEATTLIFDRATGRASETELADSELISQATHLVIHPEKRLAAIEYVRRGAKAVQIGPAIASVLKSNTSDFRLLDLEFPPKIAKGFSEQIATFERIRVASLRITRPNASWTDHYTDLSDLMETSGGEKAEIDVRAGRGASLEKNKGIVQVIKEISEDEHPYIEEAAITGTRANESAETVVRSSTHILHTRVSVEANNSGEVYDNSIRSKLVSFISSWL